MRRQPVTPVAHTNMQVFRQFRPGAGTFARCARRNRAAGPGPIRSQGACASPQPWSV